MNPTDEVTELYIARLEIAELKETLEKERRDYSTPRAYQAAEKLLQAEVATLRRQLVDLSQRSVASASVARRAQLAQQYCEYALASFAVFALIALVFCFSSHF